MARVTVSDCMDKVPNRFELVRLASRRARQLDHYGMAPLVPEDGDKSTIIALREIAEGRIDDATMDELQKQRTEAEVMHRFGDLERESRSRQEQSHLFESLSGSLETPPDGPRSASPLLPPLSDDPAER